MDITIQSHIRDLDWEVQQYQIIGKYRLRGLLTCENRCQSNDYSHEIIRVWFLGIRWEGGQQEFSLKFIDGNILHQ